MKACNLIIAVALIVVAVAPMPAQVADYGDAPDGGTFNGMPLNYNSLAASQGPRHTTAGTSTFWIANNKGLLAPDTENDSRQVNQDIDNGQPFVFVYLLSIPAPAKVTVPVVTSPSHNPATTLYLNVAADVDDDFDYENNPDVNWVVRNKPFNMPADTTLGIVSDWFGFGSNLMLFPIWLRASVTDVPVANGWHDGTTTNVYGDGETEDWFYTFGRGDGPYPPDWTNPPRDPGDTMKMKKRRPNPPPPTKCAKMYYPKVVYVKCGKVKCFTVTVRNCNGEDLTDVGLDFKFKAGNPLPGPPGVVGATVPGPPYTVKANKKAKFTVCVTGWPCDPNIEDRWARYEIKLKYDPDGLYEEYIGDIVFGSHETPFLDSSFTAYLGAEPLVDSVDSPIWEATVGQSMNYNLVAFTGRTDFGMRWITGQPILVPKKMPAWASLLPTGGTIDSNFYMVTGIPPLNAPGLDTVVLTVTSDLPPDTLLVKPRDIVFPIHTTMQNVAPVFDSTLPAIVTMAAGQTLSGNLEVSDPDITMGRRDTTFIDYYFYDPVGDSVIEPDAQPTFIDNGDGTASFLWTPSQMDIGSYELRSVAWDYSFAEAMAVTDLTIGVGTGSTLEPTAWLQIQPNPFRSQTVIEFALAEQSEIQVDVIDLQGRVVQRLAMGSYPAGTSRITWDASGLAAGTYLYRLRTADMVATRKAVILK